MIWLHTNALMYHVSYVPYRVDDYDQVSASDSESMETSVELSGVSDGGKKPAQDEEVSTEEG